MHTKIVQLLGRAHSAFEFYARVSTIYVRTRIHDPLRQLLRSVFRKRLPVIDHHRNRLGRLYNQTKRTQTPGNRLSFRYHVITTRHGQNACRRGDKRFFSRHSFRSPIDKYFFFFCEHKQRKEPKSRLTPKVTAKVQQNR